MKMCTYASQVSSPYIHFMLANIPKEICVHSLKHSLDILEKYVGKRPVIGWNPECGWASYIPDVYKEAGNLHLGYFYAFVHIIFRLGYILYLSE